MLVCFLGTPGHRSGLRERGGTAPQRRLWGGPDRAGKEMTQLPGNTVSFSLTAASPSSHPGLGSVHQDTFLPQRVSPSPPLSPVGFGPIHPCRGTCGVTREKILGGSDGAAGITGVPPFAAPCTASSRGAEPSPALQTPPRRFCSLPAASHHDLHLGQELWDHNRAPAQPSRLFGIGSAAYTDPTPPSPPQPRFCSRSVL